MSRFECVINNCGRAFSYDHALSYFIHIREDHSRTYHENKEYVDAKIKTLKAEDEEWDEEEIEDLEEAREIVEEKEEDGRWAI